MSDPVISVCILTSRPDGLDLCLASLRAQVGAPPFEVLVGGPDPSREVLGVVAQHFPGAPVCDIGERFPGEARNPLIERAEGELLLFLDDDVTVPADLLRQLASIAAEYPDVAVFGGPNETPPGSSRFQVVQGAVLSSMVGAGPVCRRYGARAAAPVDEQWFTLCNLAVRRQTMLPFLEDLLGGEENALLNELSARGQRMRYEPRLRAFHERRPTLGSFAVQMEKYGRGRGQLLRRQPSSARVAYLIPSALVAYLAGLPALRALSAPSLPLVAPLILYALLVSLSAARVGWTLRWPHTAAMAATLTCLVHVCYGVGVLRGVMLRPSRRTHAPARWLAPAGQEQT